MSRNLHVRSLLFFFFNDTATTEIYTLSLHDALPIFALLPGLAPQAAPYHTVPDPELARQRRPCSGMPEGVGRVQDVEPAAQPLRVGGPDQQIPHQPFARRDLLVGEYVPRPHL